MKILFMGTPDFAIPSLREICDAGEEIVGVITQPDKPRGRGHELQPTPVKAFALSRGLDVYQPETLRGEEFMELLRKLDPELVAVTAYGKILPEEVINFPKYGCINVHGSLLPEYRGAAPMQRAIIDGKSETGVTIMYMEKGLDTGDMLLVEKCKIEENDNFEDIHDRLSEMGAKALVRVVEDIKTGRVARVKQDDALATYARKIEKSDCAIDFSKSAEVVHNQIRGLSPVPVSFTKTPDGKLLKVVASRIVSRDKVLGKVGEVISADEEICVACGVGAVALLRVIPEGKGRMSAADFVRGRKIKTGDILASADNNNGDVTTND